MLSIFLDFHSTLYEIIIIISLARSHVSDANLSFEPEITENASQFIVTSLIISLFTPNRSSRSDVYFATACLIPARLIELKEFLDFDSRLRE